MLYEKFRQEVVRILEEQGRPITWNELKASSTKLKQKAPYHVYVQKLQGDIGLVRFKHDQRTLWALRTWFEAGQFRELLPQQVRFTILVVKKEYALAATEYGELRRIYPLKLGLRCWDVLEAAIADFYPEEDRRPESMRLKPDGMTVVRVIEDDEERIRIADRLAESGEFLHTDAWKGKTVGLTRPRFRCFYFYDSSCQFFCDQSMCVGHDMVVAPSNEEMSIAGDRVYFLVEAVERARGEFIWASPRVEWCISSVIALTDPRQRRLL